MAADNRVAPAQWLAKQIETDDPDLLRSMVKTMAEALMSAEADNLCGAAYGPAHGPTGRIRLPVSDVRARLDGCGDIRGMIFPMVRTARGICARQSTSMSRPATALLKRVPQVGFLPGTLVSTGRFGL